MNDSSDRLQARRYRAGALLVLMIAWTLLVFRLDEVPPGLQHDQMFNSLDALAIGRGNFPFYFPANFGREPLGIYPFGLTFTLLGGQHVAWELRFTSVIWSLVALSLSLSLARRYMPRMGALVAGALLAGSFWFIFNARLGLEPVVLMTLATAVIYFLNRALTDRSWGAFAVAGVIGGLAIYTYLASRGLFGLLALLVGYEALRWLVGRLGHRSPSQRLSQTSIPGLLLTLLLMAAISAPLLVYLQAQPATADLRVGELAGAASAALRGDLRPLLANVRETVLAVLWAGPYSLPYHYNVPGRPVLSPLLAVFFVIGLVLTLLRLGRSTEFLLIAALLVGLLPDFITGADALHMRGVIALPLIFILVARGLWKTGASVVDELTKRSSTAHALWSRVATVALLLLLGWHVVATSIAYFVDWAQAEPTQRIYNADFRAVAAYLDAYPTDAPVFIGTDRLVDLDSKTFQLYKPTREDARWFPAQENLPLPAAGPGVYFLPTSVDALSPASARLADAAHERFTLPGPSGQFDLMQGLRLSPDDVARVMQEAHGQVLAPPPVYGQSLRLDAAGAAHQDDAIEILTHWTVVGPWPHPTPPGQPRQPMKVSVSLVDETGYKWTQSDQPSSLPWTFWRPDDSYLELTRLSLPSDLPPGDYTVRLALYDDVGGTVTASSTAAAGSADAPVATARVELPIGGAPPAAPYPFEQTAGGDALAPVSRWEPVDILVAGLPSDVHLAWRAGQALATEGLRFRLQAKGQDGDVFWEQRLDPLKPLPAVWPAGQTYRLTHRIEPQALPAGASDARLEVCALRDGVELACGLAGQPRVVEQPPVLELSKAPQHAVDAEWNEQLALAGYDVDTNEGRFALTLYWRVEQAPAESLKRFVHALDSGGRIVAQADDVPANGALPMPFWRAGEYVVDQVELQPPVDASATEFCVGWYEIASGARLPVRLANGEEPANEQLCVSLPVEASESGTVTPLSPPGGSQWVELTTIEVES